MVSGPIFFAPFFISYYADNGDTILDSDGQGQIILGGITLTGGTRLLGTQLFFSDDKKVVYRQNQDGSVDVTNYYAEGAIGAVDDKTWRVVA